MDYMKITATVNRRRPAIRHFATAALALLIFAAFGGSVARGANVTLTDLNSTVNFETGTINGMKDWLVDGVDQLFRQWIWYRVGTSGPEQPINTLDHDDMADVTVSDDDLDAGNEHLFTRYFDPNGDFEIQVDYVLTGGTSGSGTSDVATVISVINNLSAPLDFHLFRYTDLDLGGTTNDAFVEILNGDTARQRDVGAGPAVFAAEVEIVATPMPSHAEVGEFFLMPNIISRLQDGDSDDLDDDPLALFGTNDYNWAFQWDIVIPADDTFVISTDNNSSLVPEPSTLVLATLGVVGLLAYGWPRRRRV